MRQPRRLEYRSFGMQTPHWSLKGSVAPAAPPVLRLPPSPDSLLHHRFLPSLLWGRQMRCDATLPTKHLARVWFMASCEIGPLLIWNQISGHLFCPGVSSRTLIWATFEFCVIPTPQLQTCVSFRLDRKSSRDHLNRYRQTRLTGYDRNQRIWMLNYHLLSQV